MLRSFFSRPRHATLLALPLCLGLAWPATTVHAQSSVTYIYDALGRVITATYSNGAVVTYAYDATDNRVTVTTTP